MKHNILTATVNYGLIQKNHDYIMISEGYDYYTVKAQGKALCVFKWVFEDDYQRR